MIQESANVLWNRPKGPAYYSLGLACKGYAQAIPGQFVMLRISQQHAPLLRRPFSIHRLIIQKGQCVGIELLYKVVGVGTRLLSSARKGDLLDILGPIGNGFRIPDRYHTVYLVGGGIGVPPLVFLATQLVQSGMSPAACRMFLGGRSEEDLLCIEDFKSLGIAVHITTDDGSAGDHCLVTHPLETAVAQSPPDGIYACGPLPMLACIVGISEKYAVACQVSIESMMACGMGACLGCAVPKRNDPDRYWHVCKDGPVFDAADVSL
ncbi:MAG: dihydroorotate dehydrogenase electron transfer subunit [Desulfobacterales bacterium]|jgi:dihydroorotate dehydrogenase electron transfer subunit|nr:dihydroorotate dehydrogenase electron transfer subunit [Desulfobacterales bacterium]